MDEELIKSVMSDLGIMSEDEEVVRSISQKVKAVKRYLINGGAKIEESYDYEVISCISIGVNDLLNNKSGETKFSPAFNILAMQICRG